MSNNQEQNFNQADEILKLTECLNDDIWDIRTALYVQLKYLERAEQFIKAHGLNDKWKVFNDVLDD